MNLDMAAREAFPRQTTLALEHFGRHVGVDGRCAATHDLHADHQRDNGAVIDVLRGDGTIEHDGVTGVSSVQDVGFVEQPILFTLKQTIVDPYTAHGVCCIVMNGVTRLDIARGRILALQKALKVVEN